MAGPHISPFALVLAMACIAALRPVGAVSNQSVVRYPSDPGDVPEAPAVQPGLSSVPIMLASGSMSMDQAVKMAEQRFKARVVRAESQQSGSRTIYVLRMLNESGRVWTVRVDASSGTVL